MTTPKLERMYDERRTRLQAAYEICPELREVVGAVRGIEERAQAKTTASVNVRSLWAIGEIAEAALAKLDKIK